MGGRRPAHQAGAISRVEAFFTSQIQAVGHGGEWGRRERFQASGYQTGMARSGNLYTCNLKLASQGLSNDGCSLCFEREAPVCVCFPLCFASPLCFANTLRHPRRTSSSSRSSPSFRFPPFLLFLSFVALLLLSRRATEIASTASEDERLERCRRVTRETLHVCVLFSLTQRKAETDRLLSACSPEKVLPRCASPKFLRAHYRVRPPSLAKAHITPKS